ncbi:MOSC domain-containing protein [Amycolatopsis jiangsuensis]|uniref:Ferredoxin-NADP reductase/MOSC domain-containing protein YiiM n=1 Tax=Amycolatopsis jiangsuensis TaxID=1181879 RepID=A0A840IZ98_9PSEU|nr:MOSC domain-containing protein [Amycolatopsis jiangsuensis]MBB4686839.1 ferredoxin-NADP reductase/MOSC domain-containing protein YiiM [Amycolatopsis jiangsuensis]
MPRLLSPNVGMPKDVSWQGRTVHTGIFKYPVEGSRMVRRLNVGGDGQGDRAGHGGEIRAVLVYQRESYEHWRTHLGRDDLEYGQFGENFTVDGPSDDEVRIGDRYRIGEAEFEVTQPRVTCFRVGLRIGEPELPALLVSHRRPGFYLRVLTEGRVRAGDEIVRTHTGRMSVTEIDALLYLPDRDPERLREAAELPALSPGWRASFRDLLDTPAEAGKSEGWTGFRPLRVTRIAPESTTVTSLHLAAPEDDPLPRPEPGQYLTVRVPVGVRNYSLSAASEREYRISVKRDGVVSTYLHTEVAVGSTLDVAAPRGEFVLAEAESTPVVLLSAGVGVTSVLAMLRALVASGSKREVHWVHTARSAAEHAFAAEVRALLAKLENGREYLFHTAPEPPAHPCRLTRETLATLGLPSTATAYLCGPDGFMTEMRAALAGLGLADDRIHSELFGTRPAINPGIAEVVHNPPHQPPGPAGDGPEITFARSGLTVPWSERYGSVLELAEACAVPTRWACRSGVCHTCVTPVLSGTVRNRPEPLEPAPAGSTLVCCARPGSDLVLDL